MNHKPRVRFAPSPTGYFHVGGARTALFNWLFARKLKGSFILRIEDTDEERNKPEWIKGIYDALNWLGLNWDEGPYRQSERYQLYKKAADKLIEQGNAYYCECSKEDVAARALPNSTPGYDGFCRDKNLGPGPKRALRFKVPPIGVTVVDDIIRGQVEFAHSSFEDFIIVKSSGGPIFVLANVVDDADMGITHIIRGEEHLPTTPKAILLWKAIYPDIPIPRYAHVPLLVNEKRQKLSKRRDPVALEDYKNQGYLPEAMLNYLVLLGWAPKDGREVLNLDEMINEFSLEEVNLSPSFFDVKKLRHFNGIYIRDLSDKDFISLCEPWLNTSKIEKTSNNLETFSKLAPLVKQRVEVLGQVIPMVEFAFADEVEIDEKSWQKSVLKNKDLSLAILSESFEKFLHLDWDVESLHKSLEEIGQNLGLKLSKTQASIRVAITGNSVGLPLFDSMVIIGRDICLLRISKAIERLKLELSD